MTNSNDRSYYLNLMTDSPDDPIRLMLNPPGKPNAPKSYEKADPLEESRYSPVPRLIHRYADRALVLVTDTCRYYCGFCFRRYHTGKGSGMLTEDQINGILRYLGKHGEIREVLLSGGDPLTIPADQLSSLLERIRATRQDIILRIGSRIPTVSPQEITESLVEILKANRPLWLLTHFNHPAELTPTVREAVERLLSAGIPLANQSVLLRKINDTLDIQVELHSRLLMFGIKPYYLLQGDLAEGTSSYRVNIKRSMELYGEMSRSLSGLALPVLAVDLPDGGGKIPLNKDYLIREEPDALIFRGKEGGEYAYPLEEES